MYEDEDLRITSAGYAVLSEKLRSMKEQLTKATSAIGEASKHGDLSENAEYDAAVQHRNMLLAYIRQLSLDISRAQIQDITETDSDVIDFGACVKLRNVTNSKDAEYRLVGSLEADVENGLLSISSALGIALVGKKAGSFVQVGVASEQREYHVKYVSFNGFDG